MDNEAEIRDPTAGESTQVVHDEKQLSDQDDNGELKGTEKALRDTKAELTRLQQERAKEREEFAERLARLEGTIGALKQVAESRQIQAQEEVADPFAFLEDAGLKEKFYEDAEVPIRAIKQTVSIIGRALAARDAEIERRLNEVKAELQKQFNRPDPEIAEKIAELRKDKELAGLDDKALFVIAKRFMRGEAEGKREYPGFAPTGARSPSGGADNSEFEKMVRAKLKEFENA